MIELIAKHTVVYPKDGKQAVANPNTRFHIAEDAVDYLLRNGAAVLVAPSADVAPVQDPVAAPATVTPETPEPAMEAAPVAPETAPAAEAEPAVAEPAKKTARKAKATE